MAIRSLDRSTVPAWFTRLVVAGLGVLSILTILRLPTQLGTDPRENYLSVLGLVLPEDTWTHSSVIVLATVFFGVGVVLWIALDRLAIIGACVTVVALLVLGSFRVEQELYSRHQLFQPFAVLLVLGLGTWLQAGKLALPRWVWTAVAVVLGWGYTLAGLEKLRTSGLAWADGTALRVWLTAFDVNDPIAHWIVDTPWVAALGQSIVLFTETTALLGLTFRRTRGFYALVLFSFHASLEIWLGLTFFGTEFALLAVAATGFMRTSASVTEEAGSPIEGEGETHSVDRLVALPR